MGAKILLALAAAVFIAVANAQLAAVFSPVGRSNDCSTWSSWGECVWTKPRNSQPGTNLYLEQLSATCKKHWFFKFIESRWGEALNNFFAYLGSVTVNTKPCGMCSYKQSCGFSGKKNCAAPPWDMGSPNGPKETRPFIPFYVAESLCCDADLGKDNQNEACYSKYSILKQNNPRDPCQLWPSDIPKLTGIDPAFEAVLRNISWVKCVPDVTPSRQRPASGGQPAEPLYCRCCCYPFTPARRGNNYVCIKVPGAPEPPVADNQCKVTGHNDNRG